MLQNFSATLNRRNVYRKRLHLYVRYFVINCASNEKRFKKYRDTLSYEKCRHILSNILKLVLRIKKLCFQKKGLA